MDENTGSDAVSQPEHSGFSELLQGISKSPPRQPQELPGLRWHNALPRSWWLTLLPVALFLFVFPLLILSTDKDVQTLFHTMRNAPGRVLTVDRAPGSSRELTQNIIHYSFAPAPGVVYYGSATVPGNSPFALLKAGAPVPVRYAVDNPSVNGIAGLLGQNLLPVVGFALFIPSMMLLIAPLLLWPFVTLLRTRRIFADGTLTTGRVDFIKRTYTYSISHGPVATASRFEVLYSFKDRAGKVRQGRHMCDNDWLVYKLDTGTEISIVYLPDRPEKSIFLEPYIG